VQDALGSVQQYAWDSGHSIARFPSRARYRSVSWVLVCSHASAAQFLPS
jgi:hypothetical protein